MLNRRDELFAGLRGNGEGHGARFQARAMYLGRNGGATLGTERVRVQDARTAREGESVNVVLQSPELRVAQAHGVPAGCRGKKPMYGITATHGVLRGQRAPGRILHAQHQIHRRAKPLGGGVAHDYVAGLGFEGPDVDVFSWEDAAIGGDGQSNRLRQRPAIDFLLHHLGQVAHHKTQRARGALRGPAPPVAIAQRRVSGEGDFVGVILGIILAALGERLKNERAFEPRGVHAGHGGFELHPRPEHLEPSLTVKIITTHPHGHHGAALAAGGVNIFDIRRLGGGGKQQPAEQQDGDPTVHARAVP